MREHIKYWYLPYGCVLFSIFIFQMENVDQIHYQIMNIYNNGGIAMVSNFCDQNNIDVTARDSDGLTLLHSAASLGLDDLARYLLDKQAIK